MKDLYKSNIVLFFLLIGFINALHPHKFKDHLNHKHHYQKKDKRGLGNNVYPYKYNNTFAYNNNQNHHHYHYNSFNLIRDKICPFYFGLGAISLSLWMFLIILYCMINRRKKSFMVIFQSNQKNCGNYMNI